MNQEKKSEFLVVCGPMWSGKTTFLIEALGEGVELEDGEIFQIDPENAVVFKPSNDDRYSLNLHSHNDKTHDVDYLVDKDNPWEIIDKLLLGDEFPGWVVIDEGMFFAPELIAVIDEILNEGISVMVAGLDQDFRGEGFGPMPELIEKADQVFPLTAICEDCGGEATMSRRTVASDEQVLVGARGKYEATCGDCHGR